MKRESVLLAVVCLAAIGCVAPAGRADLDGPLRVAAVHSAGALLDVDSVFNRSFDRIIVFAPCESPEEIQGALGFEWPDATQLDSTDFCGDTDRLRYLMVVVLDNGVHAWDLLNASSSEDQLLWDAAWGAPTVLGPGTEIHVRSEPGGLALEVVDQP